MNPRLDALVDHYFQRHHGLGIEALLAPISEAAPAGPSLRGGVVYRQLNEARRQDDPSLPMGPWAHELKRADWYEAGALATQALATQSKDLQLAVWLLEAELMVRGLEALAPALGLIHALCERYWAVLHPQGADLEFRTNLFRWINDKLQPALRMVPVTAQGGTRRDYTWVDWEQATRNEQLRNKGGSEARRGEGVAMSEFSAAMSSTSTEAHLANLRALSAATRAGDELEALLDELCGDEAPGLAGLRGLIEQIRALVESEVKRRGVAPGSTAFLRDDPVGEAGEETAAEGETDETGEEAGEVAGPPMAAGENPAVTRADAYALLAEIADYLLQVEPHSPVPYLVRRAVEWGSMDTRELYEELFLRQNGQLNIFEMLGVQAGQEPQG